MKTKNLIFCCAAGALLSSVFGNLKAQTENTTSTGNIYLDSKAFAYSDSLTVEDDTISYVRASGVSELDITDTRSVNDLPSFLTRAFRLDFKQRTTIGVPTLSLRQSISCARLQKWNSSLQETSTSPILPRPTP